MPLGRWGSLFAALRGQLWVSHIHHLGGIGFSSQLVTWTQGH